MMSSTAVWEVLVRTKRDVVAGNDIAELAHRLGHKPEHVVRHLRREGYILPLFKGHYYVRRSEEMRLGEERFNSFEMFALAADAKGIGRWYFGLNTALRLNGMTYEDCREEDVICDRFYRIKGVAIGGRVFVIHKWVASILEFGFLEKNLYRYSDPEKTVLDLAYMDYWSSRRGRAVGRAWREHIGSVDARIVRRYLHHYPDVVASSVEAAL
jgi:hypothetical protein